MFTDPTFCMQTIETLVDYGMKFHDNFMLYYGANQNTALCIAIENNVPWHIITFLIEKDARLLVIKSNVLRGNSYAPDVLPLDLALRNGLSWTLIINLSPTVYDCDEYTGNVKVEFVKNAFLQPKYEGVETSEILRVLLDLNGSTSIADMYNCQSNAGESLLHLCISFQKDVTVDLIDKLAGPNNEILLLMDDEKKTPLQLALTNGFEEKIIRKLLPSPSNPIDIRKIVDKDERTNLQAAIREGYEIEILRLLIDKDKTVLRISRVGTKFPIYDAIASKCSYEILEMLCAQGRDHPAICREHSEDYPIPLLYALNHKLSARSMGLFIDSQQELLCEPIEDETNMTPLHYFIQSNTHSAYKSSTYSKHDKDFFDTLDLLIGTSRKALLVADSEDQLPVHLAISFSYSAEVIRKLIPRPPVCRLPVHNVVSLQTVQAEYEDSMEQYFDTIYGDGDSPLMTVLRNDELAFDKSLVEHMCQTMNTPEYSLCGINKWSHELPLNFAISHGLPADIIAVLIKYSRSYLALEGQNLRSIMDGTPLHVAINCKRGIDILRMLIDKDGKALNCVDKLNQTPLLLMLERCLDTIELVTFVNDCARNVNITTNFWQSFTHRDNEGNTLMHKLLDCVLYESLSDDSKDPKIKNLMEILAATGERLLLIRNKKRQTPLHLALSNIRCYYFPDADLNVPKMDQFSKGILKLIDEKQKVLTMQDTDGMTPLHLILGIPCNNMDILCHFKDDAQNVISLANIIGLSPYALAKKQGIKNDLVLKWLHPGNTSSMK